MLSNNQNQPKCLKCGTPMNEATCPNCGFNVMEKSFVSIDQVGQFKGFYKNELAFFKEHNVHEIYQNGFVYYKAGEYKEAFQCYHKAAELGHVAAQSMLGFMYGEGKGVESNAEESVK